MMLTTCSHLSEDIKNYSDEFPISQHVHVHHLKPIKKIEKNVGKKLIIFCEGGMGDGDYLFAENSAKIIDLVF